MDMDPNKKKPQKKRRPNSQKMTKVYSTINDHVVSDKKIIQIRKNQFDATAALVYGLNISLIHFALFIMTAFIVKWPDIEKAKKFDRAYDGDLFETIGR